MCIRAGLLILFITISLCSLGQQKTSRVLDIQHWQTATGTRVYFVRTPEVPMVQINVVFPAGSGRDGEQAGIAQFTNAMLNQGTQNLNADQIADQFEAVGAQYNANTTRDMAIASLQTLVDEKYLNPALNVFSQVLSQPSFPQNAFLRTQQQILSAISKQQQQPEAVAKKTFFAKLYEKQPYANPVLGLSDTVGKLTVSDLQSFYKQYYVAKSAIVTIVGAVDRKQAEMIATQLSQHLPSGNSVANLPDAKPNAQVIRNINFPSAQTTIMMGEVGINYQSPDYFPLLVGNYALGAAPLTSRLFTEVREKRGLAYSVVSFFVPLEAKGPFLVILQSRNTEAKQALQVVQQSLKTFTQTGPAIDELQITKRKIVNGFPLTLAGNDAISQNLIMIGYYHLPLDFLDTYRAKVNAVTTEQIKTAFQKHVQLNRMVTVLVGNSS